jgi:hypothetical protein
MFHQPKEQTVMANTKRANEVREILSLDTDELVRRAHGQLKLFETLDEVYDFLAEEMVDEETGESWTAHTTNPVPFILVNYDPSYTLKEGGCLADIAPTLIEMMGMEKPAEMTGESLLVMK